MYEMSVANVPQQKFESR